MPKAATSRAGWTTVALGDVVRLSTERSSNPGSDGFERFVGLEHIEPGDLRIRRWGDIANGTTFSSVFRPGQVLFGKRRAYQRKVAVADFRGVCSGDIYVLEPKGKDLLPELLPFICQTDAFFEHAVGTSAGSLSPRTNWTSLSGFEFDLPPIEEQRRIAEVVQAMEAVIAALQEAKDLAWSTILASYDAATAAADSCWQLAPIGQALQIENRGRKPLSSIVRAEIQGEFPYYGATGQIDSISEYRFDGTYALIGEDGDHFLKYNKQSMTQLISGRFNVNNHAHVIAGTAQCLAEWFYHYYRYRDIRPWLAKQGSGRLKLKKATLEAMPIALPPIDEQRTIIERLRGISDAGDAIEQRIQNGRVVQQQTLRTCLGNA